MTDLSVIILMDSAEEVRILLNELKRKGYDLNHRCLNSVETLRAALDEHAWDLIIAGGCRLSDLGPREALEALRESGRDTPFIIVSDTFDDQSAAAFLKAGAHDYIQKDNVAQLCGAIEREIKSASVRAWRRQAEEALRKSEARVRFLTENARDLIFFRIEICPQLRYEYVSEAAASILGYSPGDFYSYPHLHKQLLIKADSVEKILDSHSLDGPVLFQCRHRNGSLIWMELHLSPIWEETGRLSALEGIARDVTERVLKEQQLKMSYAKIEALSNRVLSILEEERARLARELHDQLGQVLTALKLDLQLLCDELSAFQRQRERLAQSIELVDTTLQIVRRQSISLRPPTLDDMGLLPAIQDMARGFMERTGIDTRLRARGFSKRLPYDVETALFRCVQESLTNVARHAQATKVTITLYQTKKALAIRVEDNGIGFCPERVKISSEHIGLAGMRERVKLLHGEIRINSKPGRGCRIDIRVPRGEKAVKEAVKSESTLGG